MAGTIVSDTIQNGAGTSTSTTNVISGCAKAWLNYNGVTPTINASYNISSVTRNAAGDYTINFTTGTFSDANYSALLTSTNREINSNSNQTHGYYSTDNVNPTTYTSTACRISTAKLISGTGIFYDMAVVSMAFFR